MRLLIIEDVEDDALLLVRELRMGGYALDFTRVETPQELHAALNDGPWDAVFADYSLPAFTGLDALRIVRERGADLPFILVSGVMGEETAVEALQAGAHDYLMKGRFARLVPALERALRDAVLRRERRQTAEELTRHREHLEELVQQRTEELAAANEELQAQSEELTASLEEILLAEKELRESEERLRNSEECQRLAIESTGLGTFYFYPQTGEVIWSEMTKRHFGLPPDARVNYDVFLAGLHPDDRGRLERLAETLLRPESGGEYSTEYRTIGFEDGRERWIAGRGRVFYDEQGQPVRFIGTTLDITERKRAAEEIERLNADLAARASELEAANVDLEAANYELEAFNYTVSHDLRGPLSIVTGYCGVLRGLRGDRLDKECLGYLYEIESGALKMSRLIDTLLRFARLSHADIRREAVDLSALAGDIAGRLHTAQPGRAATVTIAQGLKVDGDRELLRVVLGNLLDNAWKYTAGKEEARIEFGAAEIAGERAFFVRDNGEGFDNEYADQLFVPFQRLPGAEEFKGHGIGLATVQRVIKRHGGQLWAEGKPGEGATFWFTLPPAGAG